MAPRRQEQVAGLAQYHGGDAVMAGQPGIEFGPSVAAVGGLENALSFRDYPDSSRIIFNEAAYTAFIKPAQRRPCLGLGGRDRGGRSFGNGCDRLGMKLGRDNAQGEN